jgi:hypothetical protein
MFWTWHHVDLKSVAVGYRYRSHRTGVLILRLSAQVTPVTLTSAIRYWANVIHRVVTPRTLM